MENKQKDASPGSHAIRTFLFVLVAFLLYAYAVDVTQINLEKPQDPQRQTVTTRVIRALAHPDFFEFQEETRSMDITIRMPCPEDIKGSQTSLGERVATLLPNCASTTQETLVLEGTGFRPRTDGLLRWYPAGAVKTTRALTAFRTDVDGNFRVEFTMSDIRPTDEPQRIEIEEKWRAGGFLGTGIVGFSEASKITLDKIVETILLALMATTVGTVLAVPISFLAARNLMENVGSPLAAIMSGIIAIPIGGFIGSQMTAWLLNLAGKVGEQGVARIGGVVLSLTLSWAIVKFGPPVFTDEEQTRTQQAVSMLRLLLSSLIAFFGIGVLANVGVVFGNWLEGNLGSFGFLGGFVFLVSDAIRVMSPGIAGLLLALAAASLGSKYGQEAVLRMSGTPARIITGVTTGLGAAIFFYGIGSGLDWLYQYDEPVLFTLYPAIIGGAAMLIVGLMLEPKRPFPIGFSIYTTIRSLLNIIRSIEPLIYVIVFAVWVGIGPFAGVLALTGHTIAALGKLFSEQVENISEGPLEAITATGANSIQTIVFGVIPQIVPPYIAFTLYRWDINVRFSTVIGFGGGGGIGFVLVQNINLLQYRQASVMMIAIAIVVMSLDYISSKIRTRII